MSDAVQSSRLLQEHPAVELIHLRDDHTRVWEVAREVETTLPDGRTGVETVKSYMHEKGSGLCYRDAAGKFVPSVPEWQETADGFLIDRCGYGLSVGKTVGSWTTFSTDGRRTFFRPFCLMASDGRIEASLGVVNPGTEGFILAGSPSTLKFPGAFGQGLDLELVAAKDGFHQNVILTNPIELPEGLQTEATDIYLYTEIDLREYAGDPSCAVSVGSAPVDVSSDPLFTEPSVIDEIMFCRPARRADGTVRDVPVWWFAESRVFDSSGQKETKATRQLFRARAAAEVYLVESIPNSFLDDALFPVVLDY